MLRDEIEKYAKRIKNIKQHIRYVTATYASDRHILIMETSFLNASRSTHNQELYTDRLYQVTEAYSTIFKLVTDVFKQVGIQRIDLGERTNHYGSLEMAVYTDINQIKSIGCIDLCINPMDIDKGFHEYNFHMSNDEADDFYLTARPKDLSKLFESCERYDLLLQMT